MAQTAAIPHLGAPVATGLAQVGKRSRRHVAGDRETIHRFVRDGQCDGPKQSSGTALGSPSDAHQVGRYFISTIFLRSGRILRSLRIAKS